MSGQRPLPIPPYPGVIPYTVDRREAEDGAGGQNSSPRLLGMEQRPVSVGSFGPPSTQTVPGLATPGELSEEQLKDKFYAYWNRQKVTTLKTQIFKHYLYVSVSGCMSLIVSCLNSSNLYSLFSCTAKPSET